VHAFDTPVAADRLGDTFDVEQGGRDVSARVESRAVGMLGSGMTVKTVADKVGYKQASHFSREFKRFFGVPPAEYVFAEIRGGDGKVIRPFRF